MARTLTDEDLDAIAHRVLELLTEAVPAPWLTTADAATLLAVSPDFVRAHAGELGGVKFAGVLRFERSKLRGALERHRLTPPPTPTRRKRPGPTRRQAAYDFPLLPIKEK